MLFQTEGWRGGGAERERWRKREMHLSLTQILAADAPPEPPPTPHLIARPVIQRGPQAAEPPSDTLRKRFPPACSEAFVSVAASLFSGAQAGHPLSCQVTGRWKHLEEEPAARPAGRPSRNPGRAWSWLSIFGGSGREGRPR